VSYIGTYPDEYPVNVPEMDESIINIDKATNGDSYIDVSLFSVIGK